MEKPISDECNPFCEKRPTKAPPEFRYFTQNTGRLQHTTVKMRNLRNKKSVTLHSKPGQTLAATAWDGDRILCASHEDDLLHLQRWQSLERTSNSEEIASFEIASDTVASFQYLAENSSICLVLEGGDVITVREDPQYGEEKIEVLGSVDAGIAAAAWSPDGELLAVVTKADTLLYMTRDFDNVADIALSSDDLKSSKHVSVGWGKKETQFKGKNARAIRDPTMPESVDQGTLSPYDRENVSITWRGDGEFVAINIIVSNVRRVIRVYARDGTLDSTSEPVNGLEGALSWRPVGNLIAGVQRLQDRTDIVFFERNGLRHGQFTLRLTADTVDWASKIDLCWNRDSSVLAVCFKDRVQLWTMGNYHYYLKQEILLSKAPLTSGLTSICWHMERPLRFLLSSNTSVMSAEYSFEIGRSQEPDEHGLVTVIDGKILKVTPLGLANVPPPMALRELTLESNILDVEVIHKTYDLVHLKVLVRGEIHTYSWQPSVDPKKLPTPINVVAVSNDKLCLERSLPTIAGNENADTQLSFQLSNNGTLTAGSHTIAKSCTSFVRTTAHLIFTTSQHLLKFVHMREKANLLEVPPDTPETDERCRSIERGARIITVIPLSFALILQMPRGNLETIYPRALVLAGIRLCIMEMKYKKAFLACRKYRVDMNILHDYASADFIKHVDLFVDQVKKVEYIDLFLSQLRNEDVSKTMYRETLTAKPAENNVSVPQDNSVPSENYCKVNRICDAFLEVLQDRDNSNLQNTITAHICKVPPDLDAGLSKVAALQKRDSDQADRAVQHICFLADVNRLYDNALGLYDIPLALLVAQQSQKDPREYLPVLQNLQNMSDLRRQHAIDDYLGRWEKALVHLHDLKVFEELKAYASKHSLYAQALQLYRYEEGKYKSIMRLYADHLHQESRYKEAGTAYEYLNDYTSASNSYRFAHCWKESLFCATSIPLDQPDLQYLARVLADSLIESKDFFSAATIHLDYLSDITAAIRLFCKGYHFAEALRIIGLRFRHDLLEPVLDAGLIEGMASMTELLAECKGQLNAQVPRIRELRAKKAEDPLAFYDGDVNNGADIPDDISLAATETSTAGGSLFTRYTNQTGTIGTDATRRTSKNKRREERKKARGKKGSVYEEDYLVNSVRRLIERLNSVIDEVERLVVGLVRRGMVERARAVDAALGDVIDRCRGCIDEVFETAQKGAHTPGVTSDGLRGGMKFEEQVSMEQEVTPRIDAPLVRSFAKLSLLSH